MKTDSLFYRLFQQRPQWVFELAGIECPAIRYELRAEEVKQTGFRLDGVFWPLEDADAPLVFAEVQFQPDEGLYARWFAEVMLYLYRRGEGRRWLGVVIYPNRGVERGPAPAYVELLELPGIHRVYLDEVIAQAHGGTGLELARLVVASPAEAVGTAERLLRGLDSENPAERLAMAELVETILVYRLPTLSREEIRKMLDLTEVDVRKTRFYQDVFAEGLLEGRMEGRQEGRQEGRKEGEATVILRQLKRRFGKLPPQGEERVRALPTDQLDSLGEDLLDFRSLEDLATWLDRHAA